MKNIAKISLSLLLLLFIILVVFTCLIIDTSSKVTNANFLDIESASLAQQTMKRTYQSLGSANKTRRLILTKQEISSLAALQHRAIPAVHLNVNLIDDIAIVDLSYQLKIDPFYINVSTLIYSSEHGISLGEVSIGQLAISGKWLLKLFEWTLNKYAIDDFGTKLISTVKQIKINPENIELKYELPASLQGDPNNKYANLMAIRDKLSLFGEVAHIQYYFNALNSFANESTRLQLSDYLSFILQQAQKKTNDSKGNLADKENYAALMALVLYFGHDKFELLIGNVINISSAHKNQQQYLRQSVLLAGRVDLQKHYIYSMAIQLFGSLQTSDAIGEFKELIDANGQGSGFSFADLLADRAGTRLAKIATKNEHSAIQLQKHFTHGVDEKMIMPSHLDLPEGISKADFERYYSSVQSIQYKQMIADIDQRLHALTVFKNQSDD